MIAWVSAGKRRGLDGIFMNSTALSDMRTVHSCILSLGLALSSDGERLRCSGTRGQSNESQARKTIGASWAEGCRSMVHICLPPGDGSCNESHQKGKCIPRMTAAYEGHESIAPPCSTSKGAMSFIKLCAFCDVVAHLWREGRLQGEGAGSVTSMPQQRLLCDARVAGCSASSGFSAIGMNAVCRDGLAPRPLPRGHPPVSGS
eukprot:6264691-Amphidinium_carterae.1